MLRQLGKPVALAVNKIDAAVRESLAHDFYLLGFEHLFPVSAEHRLGIEELLDHVTASFDAVSSTDGNQPGARIKVAIIGRPNVGKSTLLNALAGYERSIVTPVAGTTRDAVDEAVTYDGIEYVFVDTAGIRRKGKTTRMAEKLSVVMARKHIGLADVVLVVTDATAGVVGLDATIAGYAHEAGKPVVLCVNKWDAAADKNKGAFVTKTRDALRYLEYAPMAFLSAKEGAGVKQLFGLVRRGWESAGKRVTTGELNRFFEKLEKDPNAKIRYLTQAGVRPPTFVVFKDNDRPLHFSFERFLVNRLREKFGFVGTPIAIKARTKPRTAPRRRT
jgi:GTP-binding protein